MFHLVGFGIPSQEGKTEAALEQGLVHKLALTVGPGGLCRGSSVPARLSGSCWGYYPLCPRTKALCSVQSHDLSLNVGLSAEPKWDLPKSSVLGCGFLAGSALGACVWKGQEPGGIHMGQARAVLHASVHPIGAPRWTPELSWPIPILPVCCSLFHGLRPVCVLLSIQNPFYFFSGAAQAISPALPTSASLDLSN